MRKIFLLYRNITILQDSYAILQGVDYSQIKYIKSIINVRFFFSDILPLILRIIH